VSATLKGQGEVFAHIILAIIEPNLLSQRRPQQSGFTPGRSTCDRIATLCNTAQQRQDFGHPTFAAFVDLRAAFDSLSQVSLPALWLFLTRFCIPDKIVRLLAVFRQVGLTAHGLKSRLVFARAVCWPGFICHRHGLVAGMLLNSGGVWPALFHLSGFR